MELLKKLFGFDPKKTTIRTEVLAGITTFVTMSYILAVNPDMFSQLEGMPGGAVFTATALAAIVGCLAMAVWGKLPFGLAPGMGLNAFFVYTVCMGMGYTWQFALTAVLIEGLLFILMTVTNIREAVVNAIPVNMRYAIGGGIGLFIAFIGLKNGGVIVNNDATLVGLGDITSGTALLTIIGIVITCFLYIKKVQGAMLIGILATTFIGIPMGITKLDGVVSLPQSVGPIFCQFEFDKIFSLDMLVVVFTFLFIDMFDTVGTLIGVCTKADMVDKKTGKIPCLKEAFMADAIATTVGAMFGTSAVSTYVESASGIKAGGKSGLTAFATSLCFLASLFLAPVFLAIPSAAVAPVLVLVGLMMMSAIIEVDFFDYTESIPAFMCIVMMPLTYSIAEGIILGLLSYVFINSLSGNLKKVSVGMYILAAAFILKYLM